MSVFFISDLHLAEARPKTTALFLKFLKEEANHATALYILGDFFEVWLGDDLIERHEYYYRVIQALAEYRNTGIPVYFMRGNRDFLIGPRFATMAKLVLLEDPYVIELYGQRILLTHGDSLCTLDTGYQWFRKVTRTKIIEKLFLRFPVKLKELLAQKIRKRSRRQFNANEIPLKFDVTLEAVQKVLQKYHAPLLVHGHTHKPGRQVLDISGGSAERIVLGEWQEQAIILKADPSGFHLIEISL
jgi:UDP-2,3-diacylglucosamine hydrolase